MKEFEINQEELKEQDLKIKKDLEDFLRSKNGLTLNIIFAFQSERHVALKFISGKGHMVHLATAFSQTEYDNDDDKPGSFEIKVNAPKLTNKNITLSVIDYLSAQFPQTRNSQIKVYRNLKNFKNKKHYAIFPANRLNAA